MRAPALLAALAFVLWLGSAPAAADNHWRFGAAYVDLVKNNARDVLGGGWGIVGEYSFSDQLSIDEAITGDVSLYVAYRAFDKNFQGTEFTVNYTSAGLKWRGGAGARPDSEGLYGGIGLALAIMRTSPSFSLTGLENTTNKLEYTVCGGANFARNVYAEISFSRTGDVMSISLENLWFTIGARF